MIDKSTLEHNISINVKHAIMEDIGDGDITAQLIPSNQSAEANVITRENMVLCGKAWADEVFRQIDNTLNVTWLFEEGDQIAANSCFLKITGNARSILSAERCALNFLQSLSATATLAAHYADLVAHTEVKLLDTRKTIPGLRIAQKYAVEVGGCFNHRIGLYDAFLIKENHIISCGSIAQSVAQARSIAPNKNVEVEVESIDELKEALSAGADIVMLDNFSTADMTKAVQLSNGQAKLEASGNVTTETLQPIAETGVDYISIGALTKDVKAIDLSMRFTTLAD